MKARPISMPLGGRITAINWAWWVATFMLVLTFLTIAGDLIVWSGQRFLPPPVSFIRGQTVFLAEMFYAVSYSAMGWLLATRLSRNPLGWIFLVLGTSMAMQLGVTFLVQEAHEVARPLSPLLLDAAWLVSTFHLLTIVVLTTVVFIRFPTGQPLTPRWRWAGWLTFFGAIGVAVGIGNQPSGLAWYPTLPNPFGAPIEYTPLLHVVTVAGLLVMITGTLLATISMVLRYRRSSNVERAQLRWIAAAVVVLALGGIPFVIVRFAVQTNEIDPGAGQLLLTIALVAGCFLPIAAAVAVLRHRLYDIDLILRRAFVYIPLTAILAGFYTAGVALVQRAFVAVTNDRSDAAIVIATLVVASMFTPVRNWLQTFVDKRFKPETADEHGDEHTLFEDVSLTVDQRVAMLEARIARLEVGASPRMFEEDDD
jgi:hypothetical protein